MRILSIFSACLLVACTPLNSKEQNTNKFEELYVLTSSLLRINSERNLYKDKNGIEHIDQLKNFKELEGIYVKYIESDFENVVFGKKRLKVVLLFAFYANQRNSAALLEYLATDLMPIFLKHGYLFVDILKELPFLAESTCKALNSHIDFEGESIITKEEFNRKFSQLFHGILDAKYMQSCVGS